MTMTMDTDYPAAIIIGGLVLLLFVFPTVAAFIAPEGRRQLFFVLTLLFVPGPLGVGFAAIAQSCPCAVSGDAWRFRFKTSLTDSVGVGFGFTRCSGGGDRS
jgi:hypothetical protein